ncbi:MAG: TRAP transporter fused permease subunit, partial [Clostridiaceae bacterium]|nr:TRAP transporter fused permease subunit [Clostridiaceae bacterium]
MNNREPEKDLKSIDDSKLEKDSDEVTRRKLGGLLGKLTSFIAITFTVFLILDQQVGILNPLPLRSLVLTITSVLAFLYYPGWKKAGHKINIVDIILVLMSLAVFFYVLAEQNNIIYRTGVSPTTLDIVFGTMMLIVTLEMGRRAVGWILPSFAVLTLIYSMWGGGLPGILSHVGYVYDRVASFIFGLDGVYGTTLGVIPTYVASFTLFGCFLQVCGAADMILDLSTAAMGRFRGGLAKVTIVASSLMGTISGSTVANVSACGTITIPQMKKANYDSAYAAGVVTAAASGGQIMPPVMGAAAFIMAEVLGISYGEICIAAALPAILYYISLIWLVDLEAQKTNQKGLSSDEVPSIRTILITKG